MNKNLFFEKINKVDKLLAKLIKNKTVKTQISIIKYEKGKVTTHNAETQRLIRDYCKQLHVNKMDNLGENWQMLEKYNFPKLNQEEIENMRKPIKSMEIKKFSYKQKPRARWLHRKNLPKV